MHSLNPPDYPDEKSNQDEQDDTTGEVRAATGAPAGEPEASDTKHKQA